MMILDKVFFWLVASSAAPETRLRDVLDVAGSVLWQFQVPSGSLLFPFSFRTLYYTPHIFITFRDHNTV